MYAVIKTGGKQYRVKPDDVIEIERIPGAAGDTVEFTSVLMVAGDSGIEVGAPLVAGATVAGELVGQTRGPRIIVFKKKRRKHYRRRNGHRQDLSEVRITDILTGGARPKAKAAAKRPKKVEEVPPPVSADVTAGPLEAPTAVAAEAEQPAATVAEAAGEAAAKPAKAKAARPKPEAPAGDDLTQISGIGPAIAKKLEGLGVTTLRQMAELTPEQAAEIADKLKGRIEREEWVEQAKDLVAGKPPRSKA